MDIPSFKFVTLRLPHEAADLFLLQRYTEQENKNACENNPNFGTILKILFIFTFFIKPPSSNSYCTTKGFIPNHA